MAIPDTGSAAGGARFCVGNYLPDSSSRVRARVRR